MSKGFDPFKPLSINTSALESSASTSSTSTSTTSTTVKKQSAVLYESLQQHPLAKYHQTSTTTVDGQSSSSRMELHKATLANATIDPVPGPGPASSSKWAWASKSHRNVLNSKIPYFSLVQSLFRCRKRRWVPSPHWRILPRAVVGRVFFCFLSSECCRFSFYHLCCTKSKVVYALILKE